MTLKPLVFFGTEDFSVPSLERLIADGWPIKLVITKPDSARGRGLKLTSPPVKALARKNSIPVLQPNKLKDIETELSKLECDFAVLVAYGKIIPASIIDLFKGGIVNVHPSLLPQLRGPAPIEGAILEGQSKTGVSLMRLSQEMDAGPVYIQAEVGLKGTETKPALYEQLARVGANLLAENLNSIVLGDLKPVGQNDREATYTKLLTKADGMVRWDEPAEDIERKVRAYLGFPKSRAVVGNKEVILLEVRLVSNLDDGKLVIPCHKSFLEILKLRAPNGREMSGEEFKRGYLK
jgi:methionyl-tRNA formyltransferase